VTTLRGGNASEGKRGFAKRALTQDDERKSAIEKSLSTKKKGGRGWGRTH